MSVLSGFTSPPMAIGQMRSSNSIPDSSPSKSQSSGSNSGSDVDSAIGERQRPTRQSKPRSRNGCWTCRQRKVKCDEVRPKCSSCTRLNKNCEWGQRWKFDDLSIRTQRRNKHVSASGSPSWDNDSGQISVRQLYTRHHPMLPVFTELNNEDEREKKALTQPPGTYNVILTPDSFSQLPEYGGLIKRYRSGSGTSATNSSHSLAGDPNLIVLSEFEDTPYFMALPERKTPMVTLASRVSNISLIQRNLTNHNTKDMDDCMLHYVNSVSKSIMPIGSRLKINSCNGEDAIVRESRTFRPLRHAICAITLLSMALKGQRNLLEGAFQHYHQAISAVMTSTSMPSGSLLYLHFILLLYDICCANQNVSPDGGVMWSQHFQQLGRLAYSPDSTEINELQAYLLWYTLYLDGQSCLAGNPESGAFVQAYQKHGSVLPAWLIPETAHQQHNSDAPDFTAVFGLSKHMCSRFAELSQLALQMRKDVELGTGSISQQQRIVTNFRNDLYSSWSMRYPALLSRDSPEAGTRLPGLSKTAFDFACFQYSTAMVYLHTSMYRGQHMHSTPHQRKETAAHCRQILTMATSTAAANGTEQHHIIFCVFLAGVNSTNDHDKNRALGIMRAMEDTGISRNVTQSRELFESVCIEQKRRTQAGGNAAEVDWISFARDRGIRIVNFGL